MCLCTTRAEKERLKAEKASKKAAAAAAEEMANRISDVTYLSHTEQETYEPMGDMSTVMSRARSGRKFVNVGDIDVQTNAGQRVWLRGRISSIRAKGGSCFLVLRQNSFDTIQACYFKDKENPDRSTKMMKYLKTLTVESMVDLEGIVSSAEVRSCSVQDAELVITRIHAVSKADAMLPFLVEDAARSENEVEESQGTDRPFPRLGQELRLDHRWLDLRAPANNAIMRKCHEVTDFSCLVKNMIHLHMLIYRIGRHPIGCMPIVSGITLLSGVCGDSHTQTYCWRE